MSVCANCEWTMDDESTTVDGLSFCCPGCAAGGPCNCSYAGADEIAADDGSAGTPGRPVRPAGWSLVAGDRTAREATDDSVLPAPRRARLGTDGT